MRTALMGTNTIREAIVELDLSTLRRSEHGSVTGVVAIRADGGTFPEVRWNDFPVVILSWWLEPVSRILQGTTRVWECRFMEGPLSVRLEQRRGDTWSLVGFRNSRVEFTATVSCRAFIRSLLDAACQILRECQHRGWQSRDIETLGSAVWTIQYNVAQPGTVASPA